MMWLRARRDRKAAERAAAEAARRESQARAWHAFWDAMNVAGGGKSIPFDAEKYQ